MDTIEQYKIIESQDLGSLAGKVNAALKEAWQPHVAPFIHVSGAAVVCCQAMVNFHQPTSAEVIAKLRRAAARAFRRKSPKKGSVGDISAAILARSNFANVS